jgi:ribosomal-protein-alanine N-acetyltransferase
VLVAAQDENAMLLGFLVARHVLQDWELENIVVAEKKRGRGIGTSLLTELVARAQMGDGATIFLEVRESNTAARGLYAKLGFKQTGCRKSYYSKPLEDAVLYSKTLRRDRR